MATFNNSWLKIFAEKDFSLEKILLQSRSQTLEILRQSLLLVVAACTHFPIHRRLNQKAKP